MSRGELVVAETIWSAKAVTFADGRTVRGTMRVAVLESMAAIAAGWRLFKLRTPALRVVAWVGNAEKTSRIAESALFVADAKSMDLHGDSRKTAPSSPTEAKRLVGARKVESVKVPG